MINVSALARTVIESGSFVYETRASAWLGGRLLAEDIPIAGGSYEETDRSLAVPERVQLTVPRRAGGVDWTPTEARSPLAANGQTIKISIGVGTGSATSEWFPRGEFLIQDTMADGETISVQAVGLLALIDEAKFVTPFQPSGTITGTLRKLLEPAVTVNLAAAPADRAVPASAVNWDSDRLAAVGELLDAWPADLLMHEQGYARVVPAATPTVGDAVRSFTDAAGGTVISATGRSSRDGGFNVVVATGYAADGGEVRGTAYVASGPWQFGTGTATPLPVPFGYSSPLLTTNVQCASAARSVLARKMRAGVLRRFTIVCPPDPTLQAADPVLVTTDDGALVDELCTVEAFTLPYTASGAMSVQVVTVA